MSKFIIFLIMLSSPLRSEIITEHSLNSFIKFFSFFSPQVEVPFCLTTKIPEGPITYFANDLNEQGYYPIVCPDPWDERAFYRRVNERYCSKRFGVSAHTCVEGDAEKVKARASNPELMDTIKKFTLKRFGEYKSKLSNKCCGDKVKCNERFQAVQLSIEPGTEVSASYHSDSNSSASTLNNRIAISEGKLASAYNTENVERVLLVELAHACQLALVSEDEIKYKIFTHPTTRCNKESGLQMFKEALGTEVSQCVINEIESQIKEIPRKEQSKYCFGKWYREAFSDMMFRSEFSSPYHWTYDMGRRSIHENYGSVSKYIRCNFPDSIKQKICI